MSAARTALVTGGAGFIGSNLADHLAQSGCRVIVFDTLERPGVDRNLEWLRERHGAKISHLREDIRDARAVESAVARADVVFHLAAQVAVTTSLVDPRHDFDVNLGGTVNVLEAARAGKTPVIFASTNKVYGDLSDVELELVDDAYAPVDAEVRRRGVSESRPIVFHTPYGCSKGGADQYVLDYARAFDVPACALRMSCIYGPRQMGVAHFLLRALAGEPITIYGDGRQVRDILEVGDAVKAYLAAWRRMEATKGKALNLGGGVANAVSLRRLIQHIETLTGAKMDVEYEDWRSGDQRYFVADATDAKSLLGLPEPLEWRLGVKRLAKWMGADLRSRRKASETVAA